MNRRHIPVHEVAAGARVFVVPRDNSTPRGPGLDAIPRDGMELQVNDYIHGAIQRGALVAYEAHEWSPDEMKAHAKETLARLPVEPEPEVPNGEAPADSEPPTSPAPEKEIG